MVPVMLAIAASSFVPDSIPMGKSMVEVTASEKVIEVYTYRPEKVEVDKIIVVFHGVLRNADDYRDNAVVLGDSFNALVIAPKFDRERFPSRKYQYGGIMNRQKEAMPQKEWTYTLIPQIVQEIRQLMESPKMPYWLIGHSAGGQFLVRMSAFFDPGAERIVAANPGSQLFPHRGAPFGYGFKDLPEELSSDEQLQKYLAAPLTLYLGTEDNAPDEYFNQSEEAMKQGGGRFQRNNNCYDFAKWLAERNDWEFNWKIVYAEGVGHDNALMFKNPACRVALFGK